MTDTIVAVADETPVGTAALENLTDTGSGNLHKAFVHLLGHFSGNDGIRQFQACYHDSSAKGTASGLHASHTCAESSSCTMQHFAFDIADGRIVFRQGLDDGLTAVVSMMFEPNGPFFSFVIH